MLQQLSMLYLNLKLDLIWIINAISPNSILIIQKYQMNGTQTGWYVDTFTIIKIVRTIKFIQNIIGQIKSVTNLVINFLFKILTSK